MPPPVPPAPPYGGLTQSSEALQGALSPIIHFMLQKKMTEYQNDQEMRRQLQLKGAELGVPMDNNADTQTLLNTLSGGIRLRQEAADALTTHLMQPQTITGESVAPTTAPETPAPTAAPTTTAPTATPQGMATAPVPSSMLTSAPTATATPAPAPTATTAAPQTPLPVQKVPQTPAGVITRGVAVQPKTTWTIDPLTGKRTLTVTSPTAEDFKVAQEAQERAWASQQASQWLQANPHLIQANPGLLEEVQAGAQKGLDRVTWLQQNYTPPLPDLLNAADASVPWSKRYATLLSKWGSNNADKVATYMKEVGGGVDIKDLDEKTRGYAMAIQATKGGGTRISPEDFMRAKQLAIKEVKDMAAYNSGLTLARVKESMRYGANIQTVAKDAAAMAGSFNDELGMYTQAKINFTSMKQWLDKVMPTLSNSAWINKPINAVLESGQIGPKGEALAMIQGLNTVMSQLEERGLLKMGVRPGTTIVEKVAETGPDVMRDTPRVLRDKFNRWSAAFNAGKDQWQKRIQESSNMLNNIGLKEAAKAIREGRFEAAKGVLSQPFEVMTENPAFSTPADFGGGK